jgi:hypothetical protein
MKAYFIFLAQQLNSGLGRLVVEASTLQTIRHTLGRTPLNECSARRRGRYLHNTQQTQETNIHALSGIRTRDPSNRAAADIRLRKHGHRNRPWRCIGSRQYRIISPLIVTWALEGGECSPPCPGRFAYVERTSVPIKYQTHLFTQY